jgi:hypothetical protein
MSLEYEIMRGMRARKSAVLIASILLSAGCGEESPKQVSYDPVSSALEPIQVGVTELSSAAPSPVRLPAVAALPAKATIVFEGELRSKEKGVPVTDTFVVQISRRDSTGSVICASGSGYGKVLGGGIVKYQLSLRGPADPGHYEIKIIGIAAGKGNPTIAVADGEIDVE